MSRRHSLAKLLSIVAFAALALSSGDDAFGALCLDQNGVKFCSSTRSCPSGSTFVNRRCSSQFGGAVCTSCSTVVLTLNIGDTVYELRPSDLGPTAATVAISRNLEKTINCTFDDSSGPINAQCTLLPTTDLFNAGETGWVCGGFEFGRCSAKGKKSEGTRKWESKCPTLDTTMANVAGCEGLVEIDFEPTDGIVDATLTVGFFAALTTKNACGTAYPPSASPKFKKFVVGTLETACTSTSNPFEEDFAIDGSKLRALATEFPIVSGPPQMANFTLTTTVTEGLGAECNPSSINKLSCPDNGGIWIAVDGAALASIGADVGALAADPSTLTCSTNGQPSECRVRDVNGDGVGDLDCRCPTCDGATALVGASSYEISGETDPGQETSLDWSAACPVDRTTPQ